MTTYPNPASTWGTTKVRGVEHFEFKDIDTVFVLRSVAHDFNTRNGFKWPKKGKVICPDWSDSRSCGNGLHGVYLSQGIEALRVYHKNGKNDKYMVLEVPSTYVRMIDSNKIKFPFANVVAVFTSIEKAVVSVQKREYDRAIAFVKENPYKFNVNHP